MIGLSARAAKDIPQINVLILKKHLKPIIFSLLSKPTNQLWQE
jgi:hypothetical protein